MAGRTVSIGDAAARLADRQLNVLLTTPVARASFLDALTGLDGVVVDVADPAEAIGDRLASADILVGAGDARGYPQELAAGIAVSPRLRWVHVVSAGTEGLAANGVPDHLLLTGPGAGVSAAVAEHAVALALTLARALPAAAAQQRGGHWDWDLHHRMRCLRGARALVIGLGEVGRAVGRLATAIGMSVAGVSQSGQSVAGFASVVCVAALPEVIGQADIVFLCLPARPATMHLFDRALLGRCRAGALLVNVGRGSAVEPGALLAALDTGRLGGAALDVTEPEPLPPDDPLWRVPGLIVTPHVAGAGDDDAFSRMAEAFVDNLARLRRGEPLANQISRNWGIACAS